jgi:hypothetical protein
MAVCANEFAFLHLFAHLDGAAALDHVAKFVNLRVARKMVPRHRDRVEVTSAICAWRRALECVVPFRKPPSALARLNFAKSPISGVVRAIILAAAILAPGLATIASLPKMKLVHRFHDAASTAELHTPRVRDVADRANA